MNIYKVRFPDKGAGVTHKNAYVIAENEENARKLCGRHPSFTMWDTESGTVEPTGLKDREQLKDKMMGVGTPNGCVLPDGSLLQRDLKNGRVVQQAP